jgi:chromate reductase, NAD(P)H dehydrogenase (quinone)
MDKHKKKIFAISGSTRINSSNEALLKLLLKMYSEVLDIEIYNQLDQLPHFNPDVSDDHVSETVKDFRRKVEQADGVLICTPEYVFSLPGALKTALEWSVSTTVFTDKPFAFIVASGLGEKAYESLELIMNTILQYKIGDDAKLLIQGARAKLNSEGDVMDEKVVDDLRKVMDSLINQINNNKLM